MASFVPIDARTFRRVSARAKKSGPRAVSVHFSREHHRITVHVDTGIDVSFDPRNAFGLEKASADELSDVRIEGAGGALHFPQLNAFFSVPRILEGFLGPMDWARREARAEASRRNGKLGGRPKKIPEHV